MVDGRLRRPCGGRIGRRCRYGPSRAASASGDPCTGRRDASLTFRRLGESVVPGCPDRGRSAAGRVSVAARGCRCGVRLGDADDASPASGAGGTAGCPSRHRPADGHWTRAAQRQAVPAGGERLLRCVPGLAAERFASRPCRLSPRDGSRRGRLHAGGDRALHGDRGRPKNAGADGQGVSGAEATLRTAPRQRGAVRRRSALRRPVRRFCLPASPTSSSTCRR